MQNVTITFKFLNEQHQTRRGVLHLSEVDVNDPLWYHSGFWVNDQLELCNQKDNKFFIMKHMIEGIIINE